MSDVTSEKITALQNIILEHANAQRTAIVADARREAEAWLRKEMTKLDRETSAVLADAKQRAEEIYRRQLLSAEREKSTEALRQQNRFLNEALKKFQDGLVHLRERKDYADILTALALEAARNMRDNAPVKLRLASADSNLGGKVADAVNSRFPEAKMAFDPEPAMILGGCVVESADGKRQINSDWQSRTQEISDTLADRLLASL
ncbi:MAG: V-type proton ATPase subunit E [Synergistaceae bacterium]|jgi:V/A-type H+-transporting ATPase subunit E|nr:V-type proton ATPase subunit E [Synergistaceae bacterium]